MNYRNLKVSFNQMLAHLVMFIDPNSENCLKDKARTLNDILVIDLESFYFHLNVAEVSV